METEEAEGMLHALSLPQTEDNYLEILLTLVFNADVLSSKQREEICRNIMHPPARRRGRRPNTQRHLAIVQLLSPPMLQFPGGDWSSLSRLEAIKRIADRWGLDPDPKDGSARTAYDNAKREIVESRSPKHDADGKALAYFDMNGTFHAGDYEQPVEPTEGA